ncbi:MAG TPA: hypothetical protein VIH75_00880 [Candidatus Sulfotelmatobacter sp.]
MNEGIAAFVQDKTALERGLFAEELVPEELTQVRMGKIIKDKYLSFRWGTFQTVRRWGGSSTTRGTTDSGVRPEVAVAPSRNDPRLKLGK